MASDVPVLLEMHIPEFRNGYQDGRRHCFDGRSPVTDVELMDSLSAWAKDGTLTEEHNPEAAYMVGQIIGSISCNAIPRQAEEPGPGEREQLFLARLHRELANHPSLELIASLVQSYWDAQDELARLLSESLYEQMQLRGTTLVTQYLIDRQAS